MEVLKNSLYWKYVGLLTLFDNKTMDLTTTMKIDYARRKLLTCWNEHDEKIENILDRIKNIVVDSNLEVTIVNKFQIEFIIYKYLFLKVARNDYTIHDDIKHLIYEYFHNLCDQRLSKEGICAVVSLKFVRNVMLENLATNNKLHELCSQINTKSYNNYFNLSLTKETDLVFVFAVMMGMIVNIDYINCYIYQILGGVFFRGVRGNLTCQQVNEVELMSPVSIEYIQEIQNKFNNEYKKGTDFLHDLIFNNYRLIGQDSSKALNTYINYMNYIMSSSKRTRKYNITGISDVDSKHRCGYSMLNGLYASLWIARFIDPEYNRHKFQREYSYLEDYYYFFDEEKCRNIIDEMVRNMGFLLKDCTCERIYQRWNLDTRAGKKSAINRIKKYVNGVLTKQNKKNYKQICANPRHKYCHVMKLLSSESFDGVIRFNDEFLLECMIDSIVVSILFTLEMNHRFVEKIKRIRDLYVPLCFRITVKDDAGHAYIKIFHNDKTWRMDPNMRYLVTEAADPSLVDIHRHMLLYKISDENMERVTMFFGGEKDEKDEKDEKRGCCVSLIIAAIVVLLVVGVIVSVIVLLPSNTTTENYNIVH
jgi:hypothetical protein